MKSHPRIPMNQRRRKTSQMTRQNHAHLRNPPIKRKNQEETITLMNTHIIAIEATAIEVIAAEGTSEADAEEAEEGLGIDEVNLGRG